MDKVTKLTKKSKRREPKKWVLYKNGTIIQESNNWEELFQAFQYWKTQAQSVWLIRNGTLPK